MSGHTPGPWETDSSSFDDVEVFGRPSWGCTWGKKKGVWRVAIVDDLCEEHPDEMRANARLIAAAPDGLEAGVDMLEVVLAAIANGDWKVDGRCDPGMAIRHMQKFIAKATQP